MIRLSWWQYEDGVWEKKERLLDCVPAQDELYLELPLGIFLDDVTLQEVKS